MFLSEKNRNFHRNIDLAISGNNAVAAWVQWEFDGNPPNTNSIETFPVKNEIITYKEVSLNGSLGDTNILECGEYHPGKIKVLLDHEGNTTLFWLAYKNRQGSLFWLNQQKQPEIIPGFENLSCGDFVVVSTCANEYWLLLQVWDKNKVEMQCVHYNTGNWEYISLPEQHFFSARPALYTTGEMVLAAWDEYHEGYYSITSCLLKENQCINSQSISSENHNVLLPAVAIDKNDTPYLAYCRERLIELYGNHANHHSEIITARMNSQDSKWENIKHLDIDFAMNPWMAAYVGSRRFPKLIVGTDNKILTYFEEKIDIKKMDPCLGRLTKCSSDNDIGSILLEGHNQYSLAPELFENGKLLVATKTQNKRFEQRMPYELHVCDPDQPVNIRPENLESHKTVPAFPLKNNSFSKRPKQESFSLYFGDLHLHSRFSMDLDGEQDELYHFARDITKLDFIAFTENDVTTFSEPLGPDQWEIIKRNADFFNQENSFTVFQGWEYTLHENPLFPSSCNSHRSVISENETIPYHSHFEETTPTPKDLVRKIKSDSILLHHHQGVGLDTITDDSIECNVEITSAWKCFMLDDEFRNRLHQLLNNDYKLGFIGASDNHERNPGLGGALTGAWAEANTRKDIFAALKARRCFATTGLRPDLRFSINDTMMGGKCEVNQPPELKIFLSGDTVIRNIIVVRDGEEIKKFEYDDNAVDVTYSDCNCPPGKHYYYIHVIFDGNQHELPFNQSTAYGIHAWSSPVWVNYCKQ